MNNNEPPQKNPKNWEKKTSIFNTFETIPDTPKTNLLILKPQKNKPPKTPFCHVQKQPTIFHKFSVFLNIQFRFWKLCFVQNTIKIVFSGKHSFSKTQLVNPLFQPCQKTPFSKKRCHFWFWAISAETPIFIVFPVLHCFGPKKFGQNR